MIRYLVKTLTKVFCMTALFAAATTQAAGLLTPQHSHLPDLEIAEHHVQVRIEDTLVYTEVTQVFSNPHDHDLEAIYSFTIPESAAVAELVLWVDGNPQYGEVVEKQSAKAIYEAEKQKGNNTALTEKNSYKTFETRVSPIRAKQTTKIKIGYYQKIKIDHSIGRYLYPLEEGGVDEQAMSFWQSNSKVTQQFSFTVDLHSSFPIAALRLPYHPQAALRQISPNHWRVELANGKAQATQDQEAKAMQVEYDNANPEEKIRSSKAVASLDNDILLYWRLQENLPAGVELHTYKASGDKRGTFMLTFTPGTELQPNSVGSDWVFILDRSGSMAGKYQSLLNGVGEALKKLRTQDRYRVFLFDSNVEEITRGFTAVSTSEVATTIAQLKKTKPGSSTNLYQAMQRGLAGLDNDRPTGLILVTDGVANVGPQAKKEFVKLIDNIDIRLFTFVMGNSANKPLLQALTKHSGGFSMNVSNSDDIVGRLQQASSKLTHHALRDLQLRIEGVNTDNVTPKKLPSLYRGEQLQVLGRYEDGGEAQIELTGKLAGEAKTFKLKVDLPRENQEYPELERLWAFAKIQDLKDDMADFNHEDHKQAITDLAIDYGIVTDYTSMLMVEEKTKQDYGIGNRNKQRLAQENAARKKRDAAPKPSRSVNQAQPTFKGNRASGGGSINLLALLLLAACCVLRKKPDA